MEIFQGFSADQLALIDSSLDTIHFDANTTIFHQDHSANYLYILLEGEVEICYKPYDGPLLTVTTVHPGGVFGWSSAMGRAVYTSSAEARCACRVYRMNNGQIHNLCANSHQTGVMFLNRLAGVIAQRVSSTHSQVLAIISHGLDLDNSCYQEES